MTKMSIAAQIFALFYAVLYGALFTISDRWRPFFVRHRSKQGSYRLALSVLFFGFFPAAYFVIAFQVWMRVPGSKIWLLALAMYCVLPLYAFHCIWSWIVQGRRTIFYSSEELDCEPIKSAFLFVGNSLLPALLAGSILILSLVGPLLVLLFVCMGTTA